MKWHRPSSPCVRSRCEACHRATQEGSTQVWPSAHRSVSSSLSSSSTLNSIVPQVTVQWRILHPWSQEGPLCGLWVRGRPAFLSSAEHHGTQFCNCSGHPFFSGAQTEPNPWGQSCCSSSQTRRRRPIPCVSWSPERNKNEASHGNLQHQREEAVSFPVCSSPLVLYFSRPLLSCHPLLPLAACASL